MTAQVTATRGKAVVTEPRPRVLMLVTSNQRRGAERFALAMAGQLTERGMNVTINSLGPSVSGPSLDVEALGRRPLALRTLARLRQRIVASDVVIACGSKTLPASVMAGLPNRRPIIYQNIGDPLFWAPGRVRRLRVRLMLRRTSAVAALTEQSLAVYRSRFGVPAGKLCVIRNARSSKRFRPFSAAEVATSRRRLHLPPGAPVLVMIAALSPEKRVDVAVSAVARLPSDVRLVVVGDGPMRADLEQLAQSEAPGRVVFLGSTDDVLPVLAAADAVILTSESEGVPGVLIEAGLCGLPVVCTDVGYVRDVVRDGVTGYLVPLGDDQALVVAVEDVLRRRRELGVNARRHCAERFDLDRAADEWASLVRSVVARAGGGSRDTT